MQLYETIILVSPEVTSEEIDSFVQDIEQMITTENGELQKKENWGKIKLGYPIKKFDEGIYLYFVYQARRGIVEKLEKKLKIMELVLRCLTVKLKAPPKEFDVKKLQRDHSEAMRNRFTGDARRHW